MQSPHYKHKKKQTNSIKAKRRKKPAGSLLGAAAAFLPDYPASIVRVSPNFGERAAGKTVSMIILHYTEMKNAELAERLLSDPKAQVSAHYVVRKDGAIVQMVAEEKRAWHAGASFWQGETDINSCSVGIEIDNNGHAAYPAAQIKALTALVKDIAARYNILPRHILAHSDIAPGRKIDPGEKFPWAFLAREGAGHYVPPEPLQEGELIKIGATGQKTAALQRLLACYGYNVEAHGYFDTRTELAVAAFQRHFRPLKIDGIADISTLATLRNLLKTLL